MDLIYIITVKIIESVKIYCEIYKKTENNTLKKTYIF
jgi:hypothetical protein